MINFENINSIESANPERSEEDFFDAVGRYVVTKNCLRILAVIIKLIILYGSKKHYENTYKKLVSKMSKNEKEELDKIIHDVGEFVKMFSKKIATICEKIYKLKNVTHAYNNLDSKNPVYINTKYITNKDELMDSQELSDVKKAVDKKIEEFTAAILKCIIVGKSSLFTRTNEIMSTTCITNGYNETERVATEIDKIWASVFNGNTSSTKTKFVVHGKTISCTYKTVIYGNDNHLYSSLTINSVSGDEKQND